MTTAMEYEAEIRRLKAEVERLKSWYAPQHSNLIDAKKAQVPKYDPKMVKREEKPTFTPEQRAGARAVLRELGLI